MTSEKPFPRPKIGIALSGGAARGMAHIGVLRALARHQIPIDYVAGTSAGSIVGGAFAAGLTFDEMEALCRSLNWFRLGSFTLSLAGLQSNKPLAAFIKREFPIQNFEDLPIPFAAVACDLHSGEQVVFSRKGEIAQAIQASCAVPGIYAPVVSNDKRLLVDGGVVAVVPTEAVRELGAEFVIAVDVNAEGIKFFGKPQNIVSILFHTAYLVLRSSSQRQNSLADFVISPRIGHLRWDEIKKSAEFIRLGEEIVDEIAEDLKKAIFSPTALDKIRSNT